MSMVGFPLLLIPLAVFNIMVFLMPGVSFAAPVLTVTLLSDVAWSVTVGDLLLTISILLLMLEIIKGARGKYLTDHLLSLFLLAGAAAEFLLLPQFGNSTFFLLTALALVDFIAGLALRARRPARLAPATAPVVGVPTHHPEPAAPRFDPPAPPAAAPVQPVVVTPPPPAPPPVTPAGPVVEPVVPAADDVARPSDVTVEPRPAPESPSR